MKFHDHSLNKWLDGCTHIKTDGQFKTYMLPTFSKLGACIINIDIEDCVSVLQSLT